MLQLPTIVQAAGGAFQCPAISKLQGIGKSAASKGQKRKLAFDAVIELRAFLDSQFNSPMFGAVLAAARMRDKSIPERETWLAGWGRIKQRMSTDGKYVGALCDQLPGILARYSAANGVQIFSDPVLRDLIRQGLV